jgi:hypothetical protein
MGVGGSDFGEEGGDGCQPAGVGLKVGQVGGAGQDLEAGGGDAFGQHGGAGLAADDVEVTDQHKGPGGDIGQPGPMPRAPGPVGRGPRR